MWRSLIWWTILLWSATSTASAHSHRDCGTPTMIRSNRRACNMFLWDAPSALLYKWCNHLLKDNLYEGRGGKLVSSWLVLVVTCVSFNAWEIIRLNTDHIYADYSHSFYYNCTTVRKIWNKFRSSATLSMLKVQSKSMLTLRWELSGPFGVVVVKAPLQTLWSTAGSNLQGGLGSGRRSRI